jgi:antitoxin component HigA of HigAB toxin-antitoxin module
VTESAYGSHHTLFDLPDPAEVMSVAEQQMKAQQAQMEQLLQTVSKVTEELQEERRCIIRRNWRKKKSSPADTSS